MSSLRVTAERLVVSEHPNADALELAQVGLYRSVVAKGAFHTGQYAVYIPEQAVLPPALIDELGLTGKLAGKSHDRVKPVRLRGQVSQGIVCRPATLASVDLQEAAQAGECFADRLGITKWIPDVPVHMAGAVAPAPDLVPWVDIENLKRYPAVFTPGEPVTATEKVHGTACLVTHVTATGRTLVTSKGFGDKRLALVESDANVYWRAVRGHGVDAFAAWLANSMDVRRVGVFGEVYGAGIQDLAYGAAARAGDTPPGYAVFDVAVDVAGDVVWLDQDEVVAEVSRFAREHAATVGGSLTVVPRLYEGPFDAQLLLELAEGTEQVSGTGAHLREGLVVRPRTERFSDVLGGRAVVKVVSDSYLLRKGGTEYQ